MVRTNGGPRAGDLFLSATFRENPAPPTLLRLHVRQTRPEDNVARGN